MDASTDLVALLLGFLGGCVLFAMLGRWSHALLTEVRSYRLAPSERRSMWSVIAVGLLHSGPWGLAIAAYIGYHVLSAPHAAWWVWVFAGIVGAPVVLIAAALIGRRFNTRNDGDLPLTPERLNLARRRTLWFGTLFYGIGMSIVMLFFAWESTRSMQLVPVAIVVVAICLGGGYVFALFMWQWEKSLLEARESERKRRPSAA